MCDAEPPFASYCAFLQLQVPAYIRPETLLEAPEQDEEFIVFHVVGGRLPGELFPC